jgi:hypothetical protein
MHCANFPRHLGRLITRCLIAHPEGADTIELARWAYGEVLPRYARHNVRRHCLSFGIPCVGKRSRRFIWALQLRRRAPPDILGTTSEAPSLGVTLAPAHAVPAAGDRGVVITEIDPTGRAAESGLSRKAVEAL